MLSEGSKFFLSSFKKAINVHMNAAMAIELYKFIVTSPSDKVGKELYAFSEKLRTQLYHIKHLDDLKAAMKEEEESDVSVVTEEE